MKNNISIIPDGQFQDKMDRDAVPFLMSVASSGYIKVKQTPEPFTDRRKSHTPSPSASRHKSPAQPLTGERPVKQMPSQTANQPASHENGCLYYESYRPSNATGAIVISHGFCESAEKYKEVIYYFTKAGYQVYLAEHRGHARSLRETDHPNMVHIHRFADYVEDLHTFITQIVIPASRGLPLYLYAHSMGGAVGTLYLETYPDIFRKAVLTAPMLGILLGSVPEPCVRALGRIMVSLHRANTYPPGQRPFQPGERFENSCCTNYERFQYYQAKKEVEPLFQNSGSSYGWIYHSLNACHLITQKKNCAKITAPVLVFRSTCDTLVKASSIRRFVKNTPGARLIDIDESRHEIYSSSCVVLENYYREIFSFLDT